MPTAVPSTGSAYTADGVVLAGKPSSGFMMANSIATPSGQSSSNPSSRLMAANSARIPGGLPLITPGHNYSLPVLATSSNVFVEGTLTHLLTPIIINSASLASSQSDLSAPATTLGLKATRIESQSTPVPSLKPNAPTSTDTVQPSHASTKATTNTAISANYWLTTQVGGHTTVVPVIVGCLGCGGKGGGIILCNFPSIPKVSFQVPKLNLPSVSFPCIPIPFIKGCSKPPMSGSLSGSVKGLLLYQHANYIRRQICP